MSHIFNKLQVSYPFPVVNLEWKIMPESFTGTGKDIIIREIYKNSFTDMLEIGSFLGSSIYFWLNSCNPLNIVAVDPFIGGWAGTHCAKLRYHHNSFLTMLPEDIECLNSKNGLYNTFIRNISLIAEYRKRLIVLRQTSQEAIPTLIELEYEPDIIFLDANKDYETLELLFQKFDKSLLTGDDYQWKNSGGQYSMRDNLAKLCQTYDLKLEHHLDTWVVYR